MKIEILSSGPGLSFVCVLVTMGEMFKPLRTISWHSPLCLVKYETDLTFLGPIACVVANYYSWDTKWSENRGPRVAIIREQLYDLPWSIGMETTCAAAAVYCLVYLTDHLHVRCRAPSPERITEQRQRRICKPWKWRRRGGRTLMKSWWGSPWPWLFNSRTPAGNGAVLDILLIGGGMISYMHTTKQSEMRMSSGRHTRRTPVLD